ncbi:MAG: hypothetical protein KAX49_11820 [Halanaerobiales bacterium]|nr:hypothetical protein [Halanaerobiales bacterium]
MKLTEERIMERISELPIDKIEEVKQILKKIKKLKKEGKDEFDNDMLQKVFQVKEILKI